MAGVFVLLSLLVSGIVPTGFMPGTINGKPAIVTCDGMSHMADPASDGSDESHMSGMSGMQGMAGMTMADSGGNHALPHGTPPAHQSSDSHHPCPFALAAAISTAPKTAVFALPLPATASHVIALASLFIATVHRPYFSQGPPSPTQV